MNPDLAYEITYAWRCIALAINESKYLWNKGRYQIDSIACAPTMMIDSENAEDWGIRRGLAVRMLSK